MSMKPEPCIVCSLLVMAPQDYNKASWGPITLYFHSDSIPTYHDRVAPRLRDALKAAIDRWYRVDRKDLGIPKEHNRP
jgi:hypothetical protein